MKELFASLAIAFSMYSVLPMPQVEWSGKRMRYILCFFPLIGLVVGGAVWGWLWLCDWLGIGNLLRAAVAVVIPIGLTGGIHMDGWCDTIDALASHAPTPRKLEILKDSHVGAFALIGCCVYLLLGAGLWSELGFSPRGGGALALEFVLSRCLSGLSVVCFPSAKPSGLVSTFAQAAEKKRSAAVLVVWAVLTAAGMLVLSPVTGGACLLAAGVAFAYYHRMAMRQFGGTTGDLAGFFLQLCELLMLGAAVFVTIGGGLG